MILELRRLELVAYLGSRALAARLSHDEIGQGNEVDWDRMNPPFGSVSFSLRNTTAMMTKDSEVSAQPVTGSSLSAPDIDVILFVAKGSRL
jgi:hypothetical protein